VTVRISDIAKSRERTRTSYFLQITVIVIAISFFAIVGIFVARYIASYVIRSPILAFALGVCSLAPIIALIILARSASPKT